MASVRAAAGFIAPVEGLRGVSVLWIMLFHFMVLREGANDPWVEALHALPALDGAISSGPLAVDLFFLISGFLLSLPWLMQAQRGLPAPDTRRFYARRFWRIAPAYYLHVALLFLVVLPLLRGTGYWRADLYVFGLNALAHGAFVHNTTPLTSGTMGVNGALWTLAVEAQFYALLPFVAPLMVRAPWRAMACALAIATTWRLAAHEGFGSLVATQLAVGAHWQWSEHAVRTLLATQLPAFAAHFALGALLARAWLAWRESERAARLALPLLPASMAALAILRSMDGPLGAFAWIACLVALGGVLLGAAADRGAFSRALLAHGALAFMGRISFSAYLWHLPVLLIWQRHGEGIPPWSLFPLYMATVVAIGWLSWRYVEQPFIGGLRRQARSASAFLRPAP